MQSRCCLLRPASPISRPVPPSRRTPTPSGRHASRHISPVAPVTGRPSSRATWRPPSAEGEGALLIDCLGTWLTSQIDELDGWDTIREEWEQVLLARLDDAVDALARTERTVVLVTNEVGMGVVPERRSGRIFSDLLGIVNQRFAAECDEVLFVVAGRALSI